MDYIKKYWYPLDRPAPTINVTAKHVALGTVAVAGAIYVAPAVFLLWSWLPWLYVGYQGYQWVSTVDDMYKLAPRVLLDKINTWWAYLSKSTTAASSASSVPPKE